jgi:hypothetical protein
MIFKLSLLPDGTITGYQMVSERDRECGPDEVQGNPGVYLNADGKYILRLVDNPDFGKVTGQTRPAPGYEGVMHDIVDTRRRIIVSREPDPPTPEEIAAKHDVVVRQAIHARYSIDEELKLQAGAIAALADGCAPGKDYDEYRAYVETCKEKTQ